jgi:hypothetical protein
VCAQVLENFLRSCAGYSVRVRVKVRVRVRVRVRVEKLCEELSWLLGDYLYN